MRLRGWSILGALLVASCARAPAAAPAGVLRTASSTDVPTLDPAIGYDTESWRFEQMLFNTLVDYDDEARLVPEVAERWEIDPTGKIYTFHLDPRVRFSHGRRLVAGDVKYSLERVLRPGTRSQGAEFFSGIEGAEALIDGSASEVSGIEIEGDDVVRIRLREADPIFLHKLAMQFGAIVPRDIAEAKGDDFSSSPVGSGPFVLDRWQRGQRLAFRRNPSYFRPGEPKLEGVEHLVGVNEQLEWLKYEAGELDVVDIPAAEFPLVARDPAFASRLVTEITMRTNFLGINTQVAPFDDVRVRRAVAHAIDRDKVLRLINRRGVPATTLIPPGIAGYDAGADALELDPERARELLREAGFADGFDTVLWSRTDETVLRLTQSYQQDLAAVGIRARIKSLSWASFLEAIRTPGLVPLFVLGWEADFPDASNFLEVLLHTRGIGSNNHSFFSDGPFDALLDRASSVLDPAERQRLLDAAQARMLEQVPMVPLYYPIAFQAISPRVRNYRLNKMRPPRYEQVEVSP